MSRVAGGAAAGIPEQVTASLDLVDRPKRAVAAGWQDREVAGGGEGIDHLVAEPRVRHPEPCVDSPQVERDGVGAERFSPLLHVLRKEGEGEFTK